MLEEKMLSVGDTIPSFSLKSDKNDIITDTSFKDKIIVLYFYPKNNTPGCTLEALNFRDFLTEFEKLKVTIFGVSKDSIDSHKSFKNQHNIKFTLLSDPDLILHKLFGVYGEKVSFGKKTLGTIRSTFIISNSKIVGSYRNVSVKGHVESILNKIKNLNNNKI